MFLITKMLNKAIELHKTGNFTEAKEVYHKIIAINADNVDNAYQLLGLIETNDNTVLAEKYFIKSLSLNPNNHITLSNYGNLLKKLDKIQQAEQMYKKALEINPNDIETFYNLALLYQNENNFSLAEKYYQKVLNINPHFIMVLNNLGIIYNDCEKYSMAIECYTKGLTIQPENSDLLLNLGKAFKGQNDLKNAIKTYKKLLNIKPKYIEALNNLALVYQLQHKYNRAYICYEKAIDINPKHGDSHWNYALALLANGQYEKGWKEYQWRWKANCFSCEKRVFTQPEWNGEDLNNKTIFIHYEQGLGDTIQFIRFVEELKKYNTNIIFETQLPLYELLKNCSFIDILIKKNDIIPKFDYYISLMSLPYILGKTVGNINSNIYIKPDVTLIKKMKLLMTDENLKVGLCWAGNPHHNNDKNRSIDYTLFDNLFIDENISFYSLQKGNTAQVANKHFAQFANWNDISSEFYDFAHTAAFMQSLDIIITVDTAVAHIAGAMGIKTILLLPFYSDWRWFNDSEQSFWYNNMIILKQKKINDWTNSILKTKEYLNY